jgi:hypothetical protein
MPTRRIVPILGGAILISALIIACDSPGTAPPAQAAAPASQVSSAPLPPPPGPVQIAADLPPLPPGINNAARPTEIVKAVYEFAARHPEVLKYMPCFCGCERSGHRGNDDCFVAGRDAKGHVTDWEFHGMGCEVCIDIGQQAMQMHNSGASVAEIRAAVDKRYGTDSRPHTPTPAPPKGGAPQD